MGGSMSSVIITGDTSGAITLAAPSVAGTNTVTLPASTGTALVQPTGASITVPTATGTMVLSNSNGYILTPGNPAFKAMLTSSGDQTYTNQTLPFNQQIINRGGGTFNTSAYSYTVPVAGVYFVGCVTYGTNSGGNATMYNNIRKNGSDAIVGTNGDIYIGNASGTVAIAPIITFGILSLAANDVLTVFASGYNGAGLYRIYTGNSEFVVYLIG